MSENSTLLPLTDEQLLAEWAVQDCTDLFHFSKNTLDFDRLTLKPHADLCDFITNTGKYKGRLKNSWKLILLPRGTFKTTVACVGYPLWLLIRDPNLRILLDSETYAKACDTLRAVKGIIATNERLRSLHGALNEPLSKEANEFIKTNRYLTWNEDAIILGSRSDFSKKEPSIAVGGVDVVKVGMHYDVVIGDDYHSEKNVTTKEQIDKVTQHIRLMSSILDPGAQYIIIGTRWDDKDAYGWIIEELEGIRIKEPGVYSGKMFDIMQYPWRWPDTPEGKLFAPEILNDETIKPLKAIHTPYSFSCQYMNDPIDSDSAIFKESWIKDNVLSPRFVESLRDEMLVFTAIDPAVGEGEDNDYSAIVTVGFAAPVDPGTGKQINMRILLDAHYGRWNPDQLIDEIFTIYRKWRPVQVGFEAVAAFDAYESRFNEHMQKRRVRVPILFYPRDNRISKPARIRAMSTLFQLGEFYTVKGARGTEEFLSEYRRYPRAKHDDVLDALTDVCKFGYFPSYAGGYEGAGSEYKPIDDITGY